jgi:hypothetical protein
MELHYIEDDLADHTWYVEVVDDFIAVVERLLSYVALGEEAETA